MPWQLYLLVPPQEPSREGLLLLAAGGFEAEVGVLPPEVLLGEATAPPEEAGATAELALDPAQLPKRGWQPRPQWASETPQKLY